MATKFIDTKTVIDLPAKGSVIKHLNNAAPGHAVWIAHAVPLLTVYSTTVFSQDTSIEITRVWHRLTASEKKPSPQSQEGELMVEHEIYFEIKNLSNAPAKCVVLLVAIS